MKADEKVVDAATGLRKTKAAMRKILAVPKSEIERRDAEWRANKDATH